MCKNVSDQAMVNLLIKHNPGVVAIIRAETLRDIEASLIDWDVIYGHETATPKVVEAHRIAEWIGHKADKLESQ